MNRKKFALSWGRKVFFGMGWPLLLLVGLNYYRARVLPTDAESVVYFLSTWVGHYGLLTSILYFLIFAPIVSLFPSYYIARTWSLLLILVTALLLLADSLVFAQYHFHLNKFLFDFILNGAIQEIFNYSQMVYAILGAVFLVVALVIWIRGERIWRGMQRRFSNPVSNWYLVVILLCLVVSHSMHIWAEASGKNKVTKLAKTFPLHFPLTAKNTLKNLDLLPNGPIYSASEEINWPLSSMKCLGQENKNLILIVADGWRQDEFNEEVTPTLAHYAQHGTLFRNHHSGGNDVLGGLFSLLYSLPATYWKAVVANEVSPVFIEELKKREYEFGVFPGAEFKLLESSNEGLTWKQWLEQRQDPNRPFFGLVLYTVPEGLGDLRTLTNATDPSPYLQRHKENIALMDQMIKESLDDLYQRELLMNTIVVITGAHGMEFNDNRQNHWGHGSNFSRTQTVVPLLVLWPGKGPAVIDQKTSHYDLVPTIMKELWECQNPASDFSFGGSLFSPIENNWHIAANTKELSIIDYEKHTIANIDAEGNFQVTDLILRAVPDSRVREELILDVLKELTRFRK